MSADGGGSARFVGPVEARSWPDQLVARVVEPGPAPRVHGYDVEADLAPHYGAADLALLALTGELPAPGVARAYEVAAAFLAPVSICEAPTHAAYLAKLSGSPTSGVVSVAAIALAEQARTLLEEHAAWLAWLAQPSNASPPARYLATRADDHASLARLRTALAPTGIVVPALAHAPTRAAALIAVLHACGLATAPQLEAAVVAARLPLALAEAFTTRAAAFAEYPMDLPPFRYEEPA